MAKLTPGSDRHPGGNELSVRYDDVRAARRGVGAEGVHRVDPEAELAKFDRQ